MGTELNRGSTIYFTFTQPDLESLNQFRLDSKHYLNSEEQCAYARLSIPKRRDEWLASRVVTKLMIQSIPGYQGFPLHAINIRKKATGQPFISVNGNHEETPGSYTLSHSNGAVFCGFSPDPDIQLGFDVERIEPRSAEFISDYLTNNEIDWLKSSRRQDNWATLLWCAKEAVLKSFQVGLSVDTRRVEIIPDVEVQIKEDWHLCKATLLDSPDEDLQVLWQAGGGFFRTMCVRKSTQFTLQEIRIE